MRILGLVSGPLAEGRKSVAALKRIFYIYEELSRNHQVDVVSAVPIRHPVGISWINQNFRIISIRLYYPTTMHYLHTMKIVPYIMVHFFHKRLRFLVSKYLTGDYDVYQFDNLFLTAWIEQVPRNRNIVYAAHNVEYDWYRPIIQRFLGARYFDRYLKKAESRACKKAALITVFTELDKKRLIELYSLESHKVLVVPMGYRATEVLKVGDQDKAVLRKKYGIPGDKNAVLYCGSDFYANQEALHKILKHIAPGIDSSVIIIIVGTICRYYESAITDKPANLMSLGFVDNIYEVYAASDLAINPVLSGSGANVKSIEYLASGLDLVTTPFGMRGYEDLGDQVFFGKIEEMAELINAYFESDVKRNDGRRIKKFEWSSIVRGFSNALENLM